jgi:elongation factor Ts
MAEITAALVKELREKTGAGFGDCKSALTESNGNVEEAVKVLRKKGLAAAGKKAGRITSEGVVGAKVQGTKAALVEVNSETDFVAQNPDFRKLVDTVADIVLASGATDVEALKQEKWPNDAEARTVEQYIASMIGTIGENLAVRRFARIDGGDDSAIGTYIHGNGKIGVVVEVKYDKSEGKAGAEALAREIAMHAAAAEPRFLTRDEVTEQDLATEREIAKDQALKSGKPENVVEKIVSGKMEKFYGETVLLEQPYIRDDKMTITDLLKQRGKDAGATFQVARYFRYRLGEGLQKREDDFAAEVAAQAGL